VEPLGAHVTPEQAHLRRDLEKLDAAPPPDLGDIFDTWLKILQRAVDMVKAEVVGGAEGRALPRDIAVKMRAVTDALSHAVRSDEALRKSAAARADKLTPEQHLALLRRAVLSLPYLERRAILLGLVDEHNALRTAAVAARTEAPVKANVAGGPSTHLVDPGPVRIL
jgi:hypothetical protein